MIKKAIKKNLKAVKEKNRPLIPIKVLLSLIHMKYQMTLMVLQEQDIKHKIIQSDLIRMILMKLLAKLVLKDVTAVVSKTAV